MKKILIAFFLLSIALCSLAEARVKYDSTGRYIIENDTIRSRRIKAEKTEYAAAAKINYDEEYTGNINKKSKKIKPFKEVYSRHNR